MQLLTVARMGWLKSLLPYFRTVDGCEILHQQTGKNYIPTQITVLNYFTYSYQLVQVFSNHSMSCDSGIFVYVVSQTQDVLDTSSEKFEIICIYDFQIIYVEFIFLNNILHIYPYMGTQAKFSAFDSHCVCFIAFFWPGEA